MTVTAAGGTHRTGMHSGENEVLTKSIVSIQCLKEISFRIK